MLKALSRIAGAVAAGVHSFGRSLSASTAFSPVGGSGYEAARTGRRLGGWNAPSAHINTMLSWQGATLRNRTRDLVRNNPYVRQAVDSYVADCVSYGFKASSQAATPERRRAINDLFRRFAETIDADGRCDFGGLLELVCRGYFEAGEMFARRRPRRPGPTPEGDGLPVPLQIQLLPADLLPLEDNRTLDNGNAVRSGIEFDAIGRRVAYWFLRRHPGDLTDQRALATLEQVRVPASEVIHVFRARDAGQIRGEPHLVAALVRTYVFDRYEDAELERKKIAAMFASFVTSKSPEEPDPQAQTDPDGTEREALEPGTTHYLLPDEDVKFAQPADVGPNYEAFMNRTLLAIAAGAGVPYASMTGDLRGANYSSMRAGTVAFRTRLEQFQWNVLIHQFCRPLWAWFVEAAALAGELPRDRAAVADAMKVKWITPKLPWVDPMKDALAEIVLVDNCVKSLSDVIEATGEDPEEVFRRIADVNKLMAELGIARVVKSAPAAAASTSDAASPATQAADAPAGNDSASGDQPADDDEEQPAARATGAA